MSLQITWYPATSLSKYLPVGCDSITKLPESTSTLASFVWVHTELNYTQCTRLSTHKTINQLTWNLQAHILNLYHLFRGEIYSIPDIVSTLLRLGFNILIWDKKEKFRIKVGQAIFYASYCLHASISVFLNPTILRVGKTYKLFNGAFKVIGIGIDTYYTFK